MKKWTWAPVIALVAGLLTCLTPSMASAAATEVRNTGTSYIGAIRVRDGVYKNGTYDDLIPPGQFSGYPSTAGIYIGPGYCVRVRAWLAGTEQNPPRPDQLGPVSIYHGESWLWFGSGSRDIRALPLSDSRCWNP
jgi:hypothetical protein